MNGLEKNVTFGEVEVYQFERDQGFETVPDKGGASLGMKKEHFDFQKFKASYYSRISYLKKFFNSSVLPDSAFPSTPPALSPEISQSVNQTLDQSLPILNKNDSINFINLKCPHQDEEDCDCYPFTTSTGRSANSKEKLKAVSLKTRIKILKDYGIKIDDKERLVCSKIRDSRRRVGCNCPQGKCDPESCFCAKSGIPCQIDRLFFPCTCGPNNCFNSNGRVEYSFNRVKNHFNHTVSNGKNEVCAKTGDCLECLRQDLDANTLINYNMKLSKYPLEKIHDCKECLDSYENNPDHSSQHSFRSALGDDNSTTAEFFSSDLTDFHSLSCLPIMNTNTNNNNHASFKTPFKIPHSHSEHNRLFELKKEFNFSFTNGTLDNSSPSLNRLSLRKRKIPKTPLNDYLKDFSTPLKRKPNHPKVNPLTDEVMIISDGETELCENYNNTTHNQLTITISEDKRSPMNPRYRSLSAESINNPKRTDDLFSAPMSPIIIIDPDDEPL